MVQKGPNVVVTVSNPNPIPILYKLVPTLTNTARGFSITHASRFAPLSFLTINAMETRVFTFAQLRAHWGPMNANDLSATGASLADLLSRVLPQGFYQYCFTAINDAGMTVSDNLTNCARFQLSPYDAPRVLYPANNAYVKPLQPQFLVFNWTPVGMPGVTNYRFELVDMDENNLAHPEDAFRSPAVRKYFETDGLMAPNLPYNMSFPPLQEGRRYAVRIQAYTPDTRDVEQQSFKNNGYSPVIVFTYKEPTTPTFRGKTQDGSQTYSEGDSKKDKPKRRKSKETEQQ